MFVTVIKNSLESIAQKKFVLIIASIEENVMVTQENVNVIRVIGEKIVDNNSVCKFVLMENVIPIQVNVIVMMDFTVNFVKIKNV